MPLILHIGYHKTGSTAIQEFLETNRSKLAESGWIVPKSLSNWLGHPELAWVFEAEPHAWQDKHYNFADVLDHYRPVLEESLDPSVNVILSSEEFCRLEFDAASMQNISRTLQPYSPVIFGYVRDPVSFLLSRYRHEVQMGSVSVSLREFILSYDNMISACFVDRVKKWNNAFPESCVFNDYSVSRSASSCIVTAFVANLGITGDYEKIINQPEKKLDINLLSFCSRINGDRSLDDRTRHAIFDRLFELSALIEDTPLDTVAERNNLNEDCRTLLASIPRFPPGTCASARSLMDLRRNARG